MIRFFTLLSGVAHITLPYLDDEAWVVDAVNPFLVAADVTGSGHYTNYPSNREAVALQLPFSDSIIPEHDIIHRGSCKFDGQVECGDKSKQMDMLTKQGLH